MVLSSESKCRDEPRQRCRPGDRQGPCESFLTYRHERGPPDQGLDLSLFGRCLAVRTSFSRQTTSPPAAFAEEQGEHQGADGKVPVAKMTSTESATRWCRIPRHQNQAGIAPATPRCPVQTVERGQGSQPEISGEEIRCDIEFTASAEADQRDGQDRRRTSLRRQRAGTSPPMQSRAA